GVSGLVPNLLKSLVFFGNVHESLKSEILHVLPFAVGCLPVRYLGLPLFSSRLSKAYCSSLIDKVKSRLFNWKNKSLSCAGRLQLIKSVVILTQVYWASSFILPKVVNAEIEQLMRGFLWSHGLSLDCKVCDIVERDRVPWKSNNGKIGDFSVSNVWADLAEVKPMVSWHKLVWFSQKIPRHAFMVWLAVNHRLETLDKIAVWQENVVTKCSLYLLTDLFGVFCKGGSMVYFIWLERNLRRFQDKRRPVKDLCGIIGDNVRLRLMSLKIKKSVQVMEAARLWDFGMEECNGGKSYFVV
nr:reverse transcriptase domain, reverse transcriptase zinc-binding domain protein [Tanacetum cinerariifolium]